MLQLQTVAGTTTANTPINISVVDNTNNNLKVSVNTVSVLIPGYYEVIGSVTVESTIAGDYGISVFANDELQGNPSIALATGASEEVTVPIYVIIEVTDTSVSGYATINLMPVGAPTIIGGTVSIKMIS